MSSDSSSSETAPVGDLPDHGGRPIRQARWLQLALLVQGKKSRLGFDAAGLEWITGHRLADHEGPLSAAEMASLSLDIDQICTQLNHYLGGQLDRSHFHIWACNMIEISVTLLMAKEQPEGQKIDSALGLLSLILDDDFASPDSSVRLCRLLLDRLQFRRTVPCRRVISEMLRELGVAHLTELGSRSAPQVTRWADIALLPRQQNSEAARHPGQAGWFQPLSISTARLWNQIAPDDHWASPENDRVPAMIGREPWLESELEGLKIFLDPGGLAEAVVDTDDIRSRDLRKAVAGFRALHQLNRCYLDGIPVHSRKEAL